MEDRVGLAEGNPAAPWPKDGDYTALLAWRKGRVKTSHTGRVTTFHFLQASRAE